MIFILSSFILRIIIATYNSFYGPIPGAESDALNFHYDALAYKDYLNGKFFYLEETYDYRIGWYYSNFLGFFYKYFQDYELLFGSVLSCVVWLLSALILLNILNFFVIDKKILNLLLFVYCWLFPTTFLYFSITLREVYILFLFNFLIYMFIDSYLNKPKFILIILFILILIPFVLLHRANIIFITIFISIILYCYLVGVIAGKKSIIFIFSISLICIPIITEIIGLDVNMFVFETIKNYRFGHYQDSGLARASYISYEDLENTRYNFLSYIYFVISNFANYLTQPLPWNVTSYKDFILIYENLIRIIFFTLAIKNFLKFKKKQTSKKLLFFYLFIALILMEIIYAQATVNWGTAARHHLVSQGLLIILALAFKNRIKKGFDTSVNMRLNK